MKIDLQLIQSCIDQNRTAQKELYLLLLPYLRAVASRYLKDNSYTKDVLQESFVKIFKNIQKYDPNKAPFKNWAARIAINTAFNYNERVTDTLTEEFILDIHEPIEIESHETITDSLLMKLLKRMPKGYFEVFNLFVIDEYNHQEIALTLGISEALSRKKLSRAKNWLQKKHNMATLNLKK